MTNLELKPNLYEAAQVSYRAQDSSPSHRRKGHERLTYANDVKAALLEQGYCYIASKDVRVPRSLRPALQSFLVECEELPADSYCAEQTRYRRHSRLILLPWENRLVLWPKSGYFQDRNINKVDGGTTRQFEPLTSTMLHNDFLAQLILADFSQTPFTEVELQQPFDVGVHVIKMMPQSQRAAVASPNNLHKDTEPFTFVHLLKRENVSGGESVVADNNKNPLLIIALTELLETLIVRDDAVYHHVMPLHLSDPNAIGSRAALLIDFTPLRPAVNQYA